MDSLHAAVLRLLQMLFQLRENSALSGSSPSEFAVTELIYAYYRVRRCHCRVTSDTEHWACQ